MPCPRTGPCQPFVDQLSLCCLVTGTTFPDPCINGTDQPVPQVIIDSALQAASEVLWAATGRQYGKCTVKIRPCSSGGKCNPCPDGGELPVFSDFGWGSGGLSGFPWYPSLDNGVWTNVSCNTCPDQCGCGKLCTTPLPFPTCCIDEVKVNGISLAPALYRVDDFSKLVRLAGDMNTENLTVANPNVTVVGPGVAQNILGVEIPTDATPYDVQLGGERRGVTFDLVYGPGVSGSIDLFGLAGGEWDFSVVSGNPLTASKSGQTLTVGTAQDAGSNVVIRVRLLDPGNISDFFIQKHLPFGNLYLKNVSWINESTTGSDRCWPECQNLSVDDTHQDTYSVTVTFGKEPPELVKLATAELACQFIKSCVGQPCLLPQRMQSISRQGITIGLLDPMAFLAQGSTGIYIVELARNTFNPARLARRAGVYSVDSVRRWTVQSGEHCPNP